MLYSTLASGTLFATGALAVGTESVYGHVSFGSSATRLSAKLQKIGPNNEPVIVGVSPEEHAGTSANFTGTQEQGGIAGSLSFKLDMEYEGLPSGVYAAGTSDPGIIYGSVSLINVAKGNLDNKWDLYNGTITHERYSDAFENFFACKEKIDGKEQTYLKYGMAKENGQAPAGCEYTTIYFE